MTSFGGPISSTFAGAAAANERLNRAESRRERERTESARRFEDTFAGRVAAAETAEAVLASSPEDDRTDQQQKRRQPGPHPSGPDPPPGSEVPYDGPHRNVVDAIDATLLETDSSALDAGGPPLPTPPGVRGLPPSIAAPPSPVPYVRLPTDLVRLATAATAAANAGPTAGPPPTTATIPVARSISGNGGSGTPSAAGPPAAAAAATPPPRTNDAAAEGTPRPRLDITG